MSINDASDRSDTEPTFDVEVLLKLPDDSLVASVLRFGVKSFALYARILIVCGTRVMCVC